MTSAHNDGADLQTCVYAMLATGVDLTHGHRRRITGAMTTPRCVSDGDRPAQRNSDVRRVKCDDDVDDDSDGEEEEVVNQRRHDDDERQHKRPNATDF